MPGMHFSGNQPPHLFFPGGFMLFSAPPRRRLNSLPSQSAPSLAWVTALKALEV